MKVLSVADGKWVIEEGSAECLLRETAYKVCKAYFNRESSWSDCRIEIRRLESITFTKENRVPLPCPSFLPELVFTARRTATFKVKIAGLWLICEIWCTVGYYNDVCWLPVEASIHIQADGQVVDAGYGFRWDFESDGTIKAVIYPTGALVGAV